MKKSVAALVGLALTVAACTSNEDPSDESSVDGPPESTTTALEGDQPVDDTPDQTTTEPEGGGEPATEPEQAPQDLEGASQGVTDDAVKVGVTYVDLESVRDFVDLDQGDYEGAFQALIDDLNEAGGIHGRAIEPVYAPINPIGTGPAEEVCVRLTQDEEVFVTIGFFLNEAPLCWVETYEAAILGGNMTEDMLARANAPWYSTDPSSDSESEAIREFARQGLLDDPFAVFSIITAEALVNDTVLPLLQELGKTPVEVGILDVPQDDLLAQNSGTQVIIEAFRANGAERVLVAGPAAITYANGSSGTDFRPPLLFTNAESTDSALTNADVDLSIFEGSTQAAGFGPDDAISALPAMAECLGIIADTGVDVGDPANSTDDTYQPWASAHAACRNVTLLEAILEKAGPNLNYATFEWAGDNLGEVVIPSTPDPVVYGPAPSSDGDFPVFLYEFDADAVGFVPIG